MFDMHRAAQRNKTKCKSGRDFRCQQSAVYYSYLVEKAVASRSGSG